MKKIPRMLDWTVFAIVLCALIFVLTPQQLPVSLYKLNLIAIAGVVGYWLDRSLFPYARPDAFQGTTDLLKSGTDSDDSFGLCFDRDFLPPNDLLFGVAMLRRAVIVSAAMIAVGLGA